MSTYVYATADEMQIRRDDGALIPVVVGNPDYDALVIAGDPIDPYDGQGSYFGSILDVIAIIPVSTSETFLSFEDGPGPGGTPNGYPYLRTMTAFIRTLMNDANQATAQATLGVVPGTHVQAHSAILDAMQESFLTTHKAKLDYLAVTQAVDLDAIETRVNALDAAVILKGTWGASAGTFPGSGAAQAGESWIVSVAGTVDGVACGVGDRIIAVVDNASTTTFAANWFLADYTDKVSSVAGKVGVVTLQVADITDMSANARTLAQSTNYAAMRALLAPGTNAFKARRSTPQAMTTGANTKVQWDSEDYDAGNTYDTVTNYRHTPTTAGTYLYCAHVVLDTLTAGRFMQLHIRKNGASVDTAVITSGATTETGEVISVPVAMNGSSDYVEVFVYHNDTVDRNVPAGAKAHFSGHWIHA